MTSIVAMTQPLYAPKEEFLVTLPEYHQTSLKPRSFQALADMYEAQTGPLGLWEIVSLDKMGNVIKRIWTKNVVTDNGATSMLKNTWNNAGSAVSIFNQIAITTNAGSTTLTTGLTNGQTNITSLAVASLPASIASGTTLTVGYGTGQTQSVTTSGLANAGATSISVNSYTSNAAYAIGTNVVPNPTTSDNPSSLGGTNTYSGALAGGAFTFSGTGAGNRQVQIQYTFSTSSPAGSYTEAWTVNTNPVAAINQTASHLIFAGQTINSTTSLQITVIEKV